MRIQARVRSVLSAAAVAAALAPSAGRAGIITQNASLPLTTTNFDSSATSPTGASVSPIVFQQFDTEGNTRQLNSVTLSFSASITNDFSMHFSNAATIIDTVGTGNSTTPGPSVTLYQPDGVHPLITASAPNDPSFLTRSVTWSPTSGLSPDFSSSLSASSPNYIAPATTTASNTLSLTNPADLALFTGAGSVSLRATGSAVSGYTSNSGNGFGSVSTMASANVTITYNWAPLNQSPEGITPEPSAMLLWGIGGCTLLAAHQFRRRKGAGDASA